MIRILIVDDHAVVRQGLRRILEESQEVEVGGEATNGVEALKKIRAEKWDVVLLDISMPEKDGVDTLKKIMEGNSEAKVLILSMHPEDRYAVQLMKAGASGYMTKDTASEHLVEAIRKVVAGKKYISLVLAELLLQECGVDSGKTLRERLCSREYQVLLLLGSGKKVCEIAKAMTISAKTVSTYRAHLLEKMNLKNNAELIFFVAQNGLRSQPSAED